MGRGAWWATVRGVAELDLIEQLTHRHIYIKLNHFVVQQKLTQHCKTNNITMR